METTGVDDFDYVRKFYENNGFETEARIAGWRMGNAFAGGSVSAISSRSFLPESTCFSAYVPPARGRNGEPPIDATFVEPAERTGPARLI